MVDHSTKLMLLCLYASTVGSSSLLECTLVTLVTLVGDLVKYSFHVKREFRKVTLSVVEMIQELKLLFVELELAGYLEQTLRTQ